MMHCQTNAPLFAFLLHISFVSYTHAAEAPINSGSYAASFASLTPMLLDSADSGLLVTMPSFDDKSWQSDEAVMAYKRHQLDVSADRLDNNALMKERFATADHIYLIAKNSPYLTDISKVARTDIEGIFTLPDMPSLVTGQLLSQTYFDTSYIIWPEDQTQLPANLTISRPIQAVIFDDSHTSSFSGDMVFSTSDFSGKLTLFDLDKDIIVTFSNPDFHHSTLSTASAVLRYDDNIFDSLVTFARLVPDEAHAKDITIWGQFTVTGPDETRLKTGYFTSLDWPDVLTTP